MDEFEAVKGYCKEIGHHSEYYLYETAKYFADI